LVVSVANAAVMSEERRASLGSAPSVIYGVGRGLT
jgi:hypothetical protein